MPDITDKDIKETLRAAGIEPSSVIDAPNGELHPDVAETLRAAGITLDTSTKPAPKEQLPKPRERQPSREVQTEADRLTGDMTPLSSLTEGMPVVGALPRLGTAAVAAGSQPVTGMGLPGEDFSTRFGKNEEALRVAQRQYDERHPAWSIPANLAGGLMLGGPLSATKLGGIMTGVRGPSLGAKVYGGMGGGAGMGGLDASLRGENPLTGMMVGGGGGAAGPFVGNAARGATGWASNYLWPRPGPLQDINPININRLTTAIGGESPASLQAARDRMGPTGFLADLNTETTTIAKGLSHGPDGSTVRAVRDPYRARSSQQRAEMDDVLNGTVGPKMDDETWKKFTKESRALAADPLYEQWRSMEVQPTDKLKALLPRLQKAGAFDMAEELSGISGEPINKAFFTSGQGKQFPTTQSWDYVKQGLDRRIDQAYTAGDKTLARTLIGLKKDLLSEIEKTSAGKVWKQARAEFASHSSLLDQHQAGRDTFVGGRNGQTVGELRDELKTLSVPEKAVRIQGLRSLADEAMGATINGDTTFQNKLLAQNNQDKIKLLIGNKEGQKLIDRMEQLKYLRDQTKEVVHGTQTGSNISATKALEPPQAQHWDPKVTEPLSWLPPSLVHGMRPSSVMDAWKGQRYGDLNNQLAKILMTPEGAQLELLLKSLQTEGTRRVSVERGSEAANALTNLMTRSGTTTARRQFLPAQ